VQNSEMMRNSLGLN